MMKPYKIYLFAVLLAFSACSPSPSYVSKYGVAYNSEREKSGGYLSSRPCGQYKTWEDSLTASPLTLIRQNRTDSANGSLSTRKVALEETDSFYSGKTFYYSPEQITLPQSVILNYDYSLEKSGNPWKIYADIGPNQKVELVTLAEADQLLKSWGLSR